jgi:hypothetical protein
LPSARRKLRTTVYHFRISGRRLCAKLARLRTAANREFQSCPGLQLAVFTSITCVALDGWQLAPGEPHLHDASLDTYGTSPNAIMLEPTAVATYCLPSNT